MSRRSALAPRSPTKRSPGPASRESITARSGPARSGSPAASSPAARAASRPADRSIMPAPPAASEVLRGLSSRTLPARACLGGRSDPQRVARDTAIVEGLLAAVLKLLALLVALAGDHHHVARLGLVDNTRDGAATVHLPLSLWPGTLHHLVDDRLGLLPARVVGRDQHTVGEPARGVSHQRALAAVPTPARPEHHVQPAAGHVPRRPQHVLERVRGV